MANDETKDESLVLKLLIFQMFSSGRTQDEIAAYVKKSKLTVNAILKPLQKLKK
jgi:hypothetical protein